jgi:DNA-binding CsgD family transcriptional regulator
VTSIVLFIDDPELRQTIAAQLDGVPGLAIVGATGDAAELRRLLAAAPVDGVLALAASGEDLADFLDDRTAPDAAPTGEAGLTPREREVLAALADGASNKAIARRLGISFHTAKFHVAAILAKLDADSRTEAVLVAARQGLVML